MDKNQYIMKVFLVSSLKMNIILTRFFHPFTLVPCHPHGETCGGYEEVDYHHYQ